MSTTQMNIRINKTVKQSGDTAIKEAGYTPTKITNLLWSYMAEHQQNKEKIDTLLDLIDPSKTDKSKQRLLLAKKLENMSEHFDKYCLNNNIKQSYEKRSLSSHKKFQSSNNSDLRDIAYKEKFNNEG